MSSTAKQGLDELFKVAGKAAIDTSMGDDTELPTSLSGAAGAIKLDPSKETAEAQKERKEKKKKCKC